MGEPNILLDAMIEEAGMSHAGLAARLNQTGREGNRPLRYDHTAVARWIRDRAIPRGDVPEMICDVLGDRLGRVVTLAEIGMDQPNEPSDEPMPLPKVVGQATALWRGDAKHQLAGRDARTIQGPAAIAPVFDWENPPDDIDVSHHGAERVRRADIDLFQAMRSRYELMYRQVGGLPVRPRVVRFLNNVVAPKLRGTYSDDVGRDLFRAAGGLVALAGICAYDADLQSLSQRYLFFGLRMAKASGDRGFGGYVVALLANQAMYLGRQRLVLQYAETALRGARGHLTPALVTDLHSLQAKASARMGDRQGCHEHMRRSEAMAARINADDEPPETGYVQPGLVECQNADALRRLGDLQAAQNYAEEAVRTATHLRGQVHRLAGLSLILAERGDVEHAVTVGSQMVDLTRGVESWRLHDRVIGVRDALRPYASSAVVREFGDQVDSLHEPL